MVADDKGLRENTLALTRQLVAESRPAVLFGYMGADNVDMVLADDRLHPSGWLWSARTAAPAAVAGKPVSGQGRPGRRGAAILRMATSLGISRIGLFHGVDTLGKARTTVDQELAAKGYAPATRGVSRRDQYRRRGRSYGGKTATGGDPGGADAGQRAICARIARTVAGYTVFALSSVNHQTML